MSLPLHDRERQQLFSKDPDVTALMLCALCGEGMVKFGRLKYRFKGCSVFERCRQTIGYTVVTAHLLVA